eukprot:9245579-Heterocapsa_arctica.AAC.1
MSKVPTLRTAPALKGNSGAVVEKWHICRYAADAAEAGQYPPRPAGNRAIVSYAVLYYIILYYTLLHNTIL